MAEGKQKQASQQSFNISNVILVIYGQKKMKGITFNLLKGRSKRETVGRTSSYPTNADVHLSYPAAVPFFLHQTRS